MIGPEGFWLSLLTLALSSLMAFLLKKKTALLRTSSTLLVSLSCLFIAWQAVIIIGGGQHIELELKIGKVHLPFLLDGLSALFLLLFSVLTLAATLYAYGYFEKIREEKLWKIYLAYPVFLAGLIGLLTVDDLGPGFTLAWQIMTFSSFFLIKFGRAEKFSLKPALTYLFFMEVAWLLIAGSAFLVTGYHLGDTLVVIGQKLSGNSPAATAIFFGFLLLGFGIKTGIFPLGQLWIPGAYSTSPPPVSALLAGILEKTGVFGLIRVFFFVSREAGAVFDADLWGRVLLAAGTLTLFIGTVQAIKQSDYLKLLAYSSIGQVGYIVFALGSSLVAQTSDSNLVRSLAVVIFVGAVYHSLNHGIFKSLLFLAGGNLLYATGSRDLNRLGGLLAVIPATGILAALASYSIAGMPASSGFVSKWLMISGNFLAGRNDLLLIFSGIVALFTAAFTLACYVKFFGLAFTSAGARWKLKKEVREVPASMLVPMIFLMVICLSQAFAPAFYVKLIDNSLLSSSGFLVGSSPFEALEASWSGLRIADGFNLLAAVSPPVMLLLVATLAFLARGLRQAGGSAEVDVPAWLCGYQELNQDNVYADRNMFSDLKKFFRWTGANDIRVAEDTEEEMVLEGRKEVVS